MPMDSDKPALPLQGDADGTENVHPFPSGPQQAPAGRDSYWDTLKFVLMACVVWGHFIRGEDTGIGARAVFNTLYMFHMPLFVFVSGRFSRIHGRRRYWAGIWHLAETFLVFHVAWSVFLFIRGDAANRPFTVPVSPYWYLLALVFWRAGVAILHPLHRSELASRTHATAVIAACVAISLLAGFLPLDGNVFSIQRMLAFLPFFVLGLKTADRNVAAFSRKIPLWLAVAGLGALFCVFLILLPGKNLNFIHHCSKSYWQGGAGDWWNGERTFGIACAKMGLRALFLAASAGIGLLVMRMVETNRKLAEWGRATMIIYVHHKLFCHLLVPCLEKAIHLRQGSLPLSALETLATLAILVWVSRYRWVEALNNPVSNLAFWVRRRLARPDGRVQPRRH